MDSFNYKKKFGQNFLKNDNIVEKIANIADIERNDLVIEVGPGKGILTEKLALKAGKVLAYEIDKDLEIDLKLMQEKYNNLEIIFGDFISRDIQEDVSNYNYDNIYFVSNVPYYITTPILMKLMSTDISFSKIVMMVQKEVGDRFAAKTCTKLYGSITVYLNYFFDIKKEFEVNRKEFFPIPNVDSVVVSFSAKKERLILRNKDIFFRLVRDSFQFKRKTIKNNLGDYNLNIVQRVLENNGYNLNSRAEQLPLEVYVELANSLE